MCCCTGAALTHAQCDLRPRHTRLADVTERRARHRQRRHLLRLHRRATVISTVARTTPIASAAIAVNAFVTCSSMAIACSGRSTRSNCNPKPQPKPKANPDLSQSLPPTPTLPLTLALRLSTHPGPTSNHHPNHRPGLRVRWLNGGHHSLLRSTAAAHARRPERGCLEPPSPRSSKSSNWTDDAATAAVCTAVRLQKAGTE